MFSTLHLSESLSLRLLGAAITVLITTFAYRYRRKSLKFLRGPPSPSFLLGHEYVMSSQTEVGNPDYQWFREYGMTFRTQACYGQDVLMIADPKALQHILHASNYRYPRSKDISLIFKKLAGRGIAWAEGSTHQRHRKVLNPAFSASQLKQYFTVFQQSAGQLAVKWEEDLLKGKGQIIDVTKWLPRVTMDVIGETAFGFHFGAIDDETNDLSIAVKDVFSDLRAQTKFDILLIALLRKLPGSFTELLEGRFESRQDIRFKRFLNTAKQVAKNLVTMKEKEEAVNGKAEEVEKDVLSILARSNDAEHPAKRLDDDEVLSQITTIIFAGHETSASTMAWMLYELSKHPEDQQRIRDEFAQVGLSGSRELASNESYDSLPFLNACIKVRVLSRKSLRLHPIGLTLVRDAGNDDAIPLSEPIVTSSGEKISQIPVSKGQRIVISIPNYNRLTTVWGDDAHTWNPSRFLDAKWETPVGVFANLLTFSGGVRSCIGWRYAVMQIQAVMLRLLDSFEFSIPLGGLDIQEVPSGLVAPMVRGKQHEGTQMPLYVKPRSPQV